MLMFFKYSNVLTITYVAFMYGTVLPILFPITFVGICNNFFMERLLLAYYYKQPGLLDNRLNDCGLDLLKKAPMFMIFFGYWFLGNRQVFFNEA